MGNFSNRKPFDITLEVILISSEGERILVTTSFVITTLVATKKDLKEWAASFVPQLRVSLVVVVVVSGRERGGAILAPLIQFGSPR